jgi:hypothetical protein
LRESVQGPVAAALVSGLRKPYQITELDRAVGKLIAEGQRRMNETNLIRFRDPRKNRAPPSDPR